MSNDPASGESSVAADLIESDGRSRINGQRETVTFNSSVRGKSSRGPLPERVGRYPVLKWLGQGGFGVVYRAHDARSGKDVAIKVLREELCEIVPQRVAFEKEAETAKRLSHANLVQVYGLEHDEARRPFIVEQYVDGPSLLEWALAKPRGADEVIAMMIPVAEAIAYLHRSRLFHRDLKPNNILLDSAGRPYVSDFGLAIHESELQLREGEVAGTFGYMAPEQIRGRTKRVDGRTDIWSMGVILYELLAGRLPFGGVSRPSGSEEYFALLTEAIEENDPEPLRTFAPGLSRDLEDICLRCLEKEKRHRFKTGDDLAEALRRYRDRQNRDWQQQDAEETAVPTPAGMATLAVVPRGLRSFERGDEDFFLDLLPGPRDQAGLPSCVSFWVERLGLARAEGRLDVCVVYGPSGSGKSSLIKAGVTPSLPEGVSSITVECNAHNTESRLAAAVRRALADSGADAAAELTLPELFQKLQQQGTVGRKFVIVLDQFEQWLHSHPEPRGTELVRAMEYCNGATLQALLLVRDDFWMPLSRFADELSISLREGENCAAVDLFDRAHARKVLILFGRAHGRLPATEKELTADQQAFLNRAIDELSEHERVICVRLALFADLMRGRPWTSKELEAVGGAKGVGVKFLEEKFGAQAPAIYRVHRVAAQRVLAALLPPAGSELRGQMRTVEQLRASAELPEKPFQDLLRILDEDLKLITPTTPAGIADDGIAEKTSGPAGQYYQLTHDFLVPALGKWLTSELRRTRRGQALLRLRERSEDWNRRPEARRLPTVAEWLAIHLLVSRRLWSPQDAHLMQAANRRIFSWAIAVLLVMAGAGAIGWEIRGRNRAVALREQLVNFDTSRVPKILSEAALTERWTRPLWERTHRDEFAVTEETASGSNADPLRLRRRMHLSLALAKWDESKLDYVLDHLGDINPDDLPAVTEALAQKKAAAIEKAWPKLKRRIEARAKEGGEETLAIASVLAGLAPADERWRGAAGAIAKDLVTARAAQFSIWLRQLSPIASELRGPLLELAKNQSASGERAQLIEALARYGADDAVTLVAAMEEVVPAELAVLRDAAKKSASAVSAAAERRFAALTAKTAEISRVNTPELAASAATLERHGGFLDAEAGWVVELPRVKFEPLNGDLAKAGYRPESVRPFEQSGQALVAASWRRDRKAFRVLMDLTTAELRARNEAASAEGLALCDVARDGRGRWWGLWVAKADGESETRFYADLPYSEHQQRLEAWPKEDFSLERFDLYAYDDEAPLATAIWRRTTDETELDVVVETRTGRTYGDLHPGLMQTDLRLHKLDAKTRDRLALYERYYENLEDATNEKSGTPRNNLEFTAARYQLNCGQFEAALATFDRLFSPTSSPLAESRAMTLLLMGRLDEAEKEIERFQAVRTPRDPKLKQAVYQQLLMVLALRQGNENLARDRLAVVEKYAPGKDFAGLDVLAHARALFLRELPAESASETDRQQAIRALQELIQRPETKLPEELVDRIHFDGLRGEVEFATLLHELDLDRRFVGAWNERSETTTKQVIGLTATEHAREARRLRQEGFLPRIISAAPTGKLGEVAAASVWEQAMPVLASEQAAARKIACLALFLASQGELARLASAMADECGIEVRSWAIEGAPAVLPLSVGVALLRQAGNDSTRRNLLRLLGTYAPSAATDDERRYLDEQTQKTSLDAGTQMAAQWLRRKWNFADASSNSSEPSSTHKNWYRTSQGQTMVVLDLREPALMGSAANDTERTSSENLHWVQVGRRVAIASTETTNSQFEQFLADPKVQAAYAKYEFQSSKRIYAPSPECPQISVRWYDAARYCQWLSEQEGLPPQEWCFPGIWQVEDGELEIPADVLKRRGYRMPTEAEMELACRGGSSATRPFGGSHVLLPAYAWFSTNSKGRTHDVGLLKPNDVGLFDILGNVNEWCLNASSAYRTPLDAMGYDDNIGASTKTDTERILRGGYFNSPARDLRSSNRIRSAPTREHSISIGFRIARTE